MAIHTCVQYVFEVSSVRRMRVHKRNDGEDRGRELFLTTQYDDISPNFCSELGFIPRTDIRELQQIVDYFWRPEHSRGK